MRGILIWGVPKKRWQMRVQYEMCQKGALDSRSLGQL